MTTMADPPTTIATAADDDGYRILALYKFVDPKLNADDLPALKQSIESHCRAHHVRGSLLLAPEGINGTISYPCKSTTEDPVVAFLESQFPGLRTRISTSPGHVFYRLKIKVKKEILTCRTTTTATETEQQQQQQQQQPQQQEEQDLLTLDPTQQVGQYVPPGPEWDALLRDPDCLVIDARNDYEVRIGTFQNAQDPNTSTFSELIPWMKTALEEQKPKKVAMFCTGGIRCEKATAACMDLARQQQQQQDDIPVYHLEGGILAYLDTVPAKESLWQGACYVFDQRVAVTHGLQAAPHYTMCHACRAPLSHEEQEGHPDFIHGLQCRYCNVARSHKSVERATARQKQIELAQQKGLLHIHDPKEKVLRVLAQKDGVVGDSSGDEEAPEMLA